MIEGVQKAVDYIKSNESYIAKAITLQNSIWQSERIEMPPLALSCWLTEEQKSWLTWYNLKEIHFDSEKMFINGLRDTLSVINGNYGAVPSMRANMGCGIIPSLFGTQQRLFEDIMPWLVDHVKKEDIKPKYDFNINDSEEFAAAMGHMDFMTEILRENDLTGKVFVYPLDLQGPIDTAHLIYGDDIFYDFYDDPEFIHQLLKVSCDAVYFAMNECFTRMDKSDAFVTHYNHLIIPADLGGIKISEDTTTLLSPALIDEFARPHLHNMLDFFGGGYVHYCGKNDHLLNVLFEEPLIRGINFGNPEKQDMTNVLERCCATGKIYVGRLPMNGGESHFDYFSRILEPAYNKIFGSFHIIPEFSCDLNERENIIGEFERAAEYVLKKYN
jgi:hypothetical protein